MTLLLILGIALIFVFIFFVLFYAMVQEIYRKIDNIENGDSSKFNQMDKPKSKENKE